jgi:dephospho-CoA kinase
MKERPFILGVCGKIASGKSNVLKILRKHGWVTVDADKIVHGLYEDGEPGQRMICDFFGEEFVKKDGSVDRVRLRKVVFNNVKKLEILNKLIHPLVFAEIFKILSSVGCDKKVALESIYFKDVDRILLVDRSVSKIKKELINKRGLTPKMADAILRIQVLPKNFDLKIVNNSTLKALEKKVIMAAWKLRQ